MQWVRKGRVGLWKRLWQSWAGPLCPGVGHGGAGHCGRTISCGSMAMHDSSLAFVLWPRAATGTVVAHEGAGLAWLAQGHSCRQCHAGRPQALPGVTQAAKGTGSGSALTLRLLSPGMPCRAAVSSHQQGAPSPASTESLGQSGCGWSPSPAGIFIGVWVWSQVPRISPGQLISAEPFTEGLTHPRACWAV